MRTVKTEFPDYDGELPVVPGFEDTSWKNDVCPSLTRDYGDGYELRLWCDYRDPERREFETEQYSIEAKTPDFPDGITLASSGRVGAALQKLRQCETMILGQKLLVLVYADNHTMPYNHGNWEYMVYTSPASANAAINSKADDGIYLTAVPLMSLLQEKA
jgi:hypothetical protein